MPAPEMMGPGRSQPSVKRNMPARNLVIEMYRMERRQAKALRPHTRGLAFRVRRLGAALLVGCACCVITSAAAAQQNNGAPNGSALFADHCAVCHGSDGRGGARGPDIATQPSIVSLSNARLQSIVTNGIPAEGMPAFGSLGSREVDALVAYLRVLQGLTGTGTAALPGDPQAGKAIFFRTGSCSECHMVKGEGGFMGADLSSFALGRTVADVEQAIGNPPARSPYANHLATAETTSGERITGLVRAQSNFVVVIQSPDGAYHSLSRSSLRSLTLSKQPYMPASYSTTLSAQQMNNLISFLLKSAQSPDVARVIPANGGAQ